MYCSLRTLLMLNILNIAFAIRPTSPGIFMDITETVNTLRKEAGNDNQHPSFGNMSLEWPTRVYYSTNEEILAHEGCGDQFVILARILNDRKFEKEVDLLLSLPLNYTYCAISLLGLIGPQFNLKIGVVPGCDANFESNLKSTVNDLQSRTGKELEFGLHFNTNIKHKRVSCKFRFNNLKLIQFVVKHIKGNEFVRSKGLWRRELNRQHSITPNTFKSSGLQIFYRVLYEALCPNELQEFIQLAEEWTDTMNNTRIIVPLGLPQNSVSCHNVSEKALVTSIPDNSEYSESVKWYFGNALTAVSQKFSVVLLTYAQYEKLARSRHSGYRHKLYDVPRKFMGTLPDIIIDFASDLMNWTDVKTKVYDPDFAHVNEHVKWLALPIFADVDHDENINYCLDFALEIENDGAFQVGFKFIENFNQSLISYEFGRLLEIMGRVNASFIIFDVALNLHLARYMEFEYFHRKVLPQLNTIFSRRNTIREKGSMADIYIQVNTKNWLFEHDHESLVFCSEQVLRINELYEAILNWASRYEFPLILKTAFGFDISSWMSIILPPKTYPEYSQFVMRNYPKNINGWETDPCIFEQNAFEVPPFVPTFFQNDQLGTILNISIRNGSPVSTEEIQTLFQFIFYRFSIAEILLQWVTEKWNVLNALSPDYLSRVGMSQSNDSNKEQFKLYLNFKIDQNEQVSVSRQKAYFYLLSMASNLKSSLGGVHFHTSDILKVLRSGQKHLFHLLTSNDDNDKALGDIPVGLIYSVSCLGDLIEPWKLEGLLKKVNYVVCPEKNIKVNSEDAEISNLGRVFDTQLYIKRTFDMIRPGISVFFKAQLDIHLDEIDQVKMDQYLRLLHHFQQFGAAYGIHYFIVEAFDKEDVSEKSSGWWTFNNFSNLADVNVYFEKGAEMQGIGTWKPLTNYKEPAPTQKQSILLLYLGVGATIFLILCSFLVALYCHKIHRKENLRKDILMEAVGVTAQISEAEPTYLNAEYKLALEDFTIDYNCILGQGTFGTVYEGVVKGQKAAIKSPNMGSGDAVFTNVLAEITVHCHLGNHQNIVSFLGTYVQEVQQGKLFIATELCSYGSLEKYLRSKKSFNLRSDVDHTNEALERGLYLEICKFSLEIASGMEYITSRNVVHGDLAARNVLLNSENVCKISDFGLSRKLYEYQKYVKKSQEPLPWKWMAYETLTQMEFTSMSDIWSYGITLYEIFSLGDIPYAGLNWTPKFPEELRGGLRLSSPPFAGQELYAKLLKCWNLNPQQRPQFSDMVEFFQNLHEKEYIDL